MKKKEIVIIVIAIIIIVGIISIYKIRKSNNTNVDISQARESRIQEIYDYGNYVESLDLPPNTVIAKLDGEEILFHEVKSRRISINYAGSDYENQNAFYELLKLKLYAKIENEYKDSRSINVEENLEKTKNAWLYGEDGKDPEEYRKEWLSVMGIEENEVWLNEEDFIKYLQERMLELNLGANGLSKVYAYAFEKPELANDEELIEKINRYEEIRNEQKNLINEGKTEEVSEKSSEIIEIYSEIVDIYTKDLILNMNLEFCVDNHELSTKVPEIKK